MPIVLEDDPQLDIEADALEAAVGDAEVAETLERFASSPGQVGDLSRGGRAGEVNVYPNPQRNDQGQMEGHGRASARRAWMWDGTESLVPLSWNPEGTEHDGGRRYLSKKHCHCCGCSGFRITTKVRGCPECQRNRCSRCNGGRDRSKVIPCFYFRKEQVPFPKDRPAVMDCFLPSCVRRGENGFPDEAAMRFHGRTKHRQEYAAFMESTRSEEGRELADLRRQVAVLTEAQLRNGHAPTPEPPVAAGTAEAPLYVSDKPKRAKK